MTRISGDNRIDTLRDKLLLLGGKTEEAVARAAKALISRDSALAEEVIEADAAIDQMELEIDRLGVTLLGGEGLSEHDLRLVVSVTKITPLLERIADHATSIAEATVIINNEPQISNYSELSVMAEMAAAMLREALDAFTAEDAAASRAIIRRDRGIDERYHQVFESLIQQLIHKPETANGTARLLFVAKNLERIGDYVKDICELNVYLREAVFIKHSEKL